MAMASKTAPAKPKPTRHPFQNALQEALHHIGKIAGVSGVLIASRDGLLVAAEGEAAEQLEVKAALAAAIFGAIDRAADNIDLGKVHATLVETPIRSLQILGLGELLLIVIAERSARMTPIRAGMAKVAGDLAQFAHIA